MNDKDINLARAIDLGYLYPSNQELALSTPGGVISAIRDGDTRYPGITIKINGVTAAIIEFANDDRKEFRIHSYIKSEDEPLHSYSWDEDGGDNGDTLLCLHPHTSKRGRD